jgi:hypothetical protein
MCLIQQMLSFALAALAACAALRWGPRASPGIRRLLFGVLAIVTAVSLRLLLVEASSLGPALTVEIGIALLAIIAIDWAACARRRPLIEFEERWANGTTARLTLCLILPGAVLLLSARDTLSAQHPVAVLLAAIMGVSRVENPRDALGQALLASGCALAGILLIACWAAYRRVRPLRAVLLGIRRVAIPAIATLVVVYIATLNATLRLDASASRAISEAAQNDLQWVLTHSSGV